MQPWAITGLKNLVWVKIISHGNDPSGHDAPELFVMLLKHGFRIIFSRHARPPIPAFIPEDVASIITKVSSTRKPATSVQV